MAKTFHVKLTGVSHKNADGTDRQEYIERFAQPGMPIALKPEPDNQFDPNAVGAWIESRIDRRGAQAIQIGYLDARLAGEVTRLMRRGGTAYAHIVEVVGGDQERPTRGVVIEITKREPGEPPQDDTNQAAPFRPTLPAPHRRPSAFAVGAGAALGRLLGRLIK